MNMFALSDVDPGEGGESDEGILVLVHPPKKRVRSILIQ